MRRKKLKTPKTKILFNDKEKVFEIIDFRNVNNREIISIAYRRDDDKFSVDGKLMEFSNLPKKIQEYFQSTKKELKMLRQVEIVK